MGDVKIAEGDAGVSAGAAGALATKSMLIFLGVAFGFTWLLLIPAALSAYGLFTLPLPSSVLITFATLGPFLGGVSAVYYQRGRPGVRALLAQMVRWRVKFALYGVALVGPALTMLAAFLLWRGLGGPRLPAPPANTWLSIPLLIVVLLLPALFEEAGWRGFAFPHLRQRYGSLPASLACAGLVHSGSRFRFLAFLCFCRLHRCPVDPVCLVI